MQLLRRTRPILDGILMLIRRNFVMFNPISQNMDLKIATSNCLTLFLRILFILMFNSGYSSVCVAPLFVL